MDISNHPCFNDKVRHTFGRIHLPVAPRCNIQCNFCNREFDCVNESRPGVTSGVLSPQQAMVYLEEALEVKKNISVVGIAGPGDPFANPIETIETMRLVRAKYPDMILCLASNGLNIAPYVDDIAEIKVSHVTITINAIDAEVAEKIYAWVRFGKRVRRADEGVKILLEKQLDAIRLLKEKGVTVKVNSIIIPGINDHHMESIAKKMAELNVDILNCIPYYPNEGAFFKDIQEPSKAMIAEIRKKAGKYIKQMHHCTRCRADAVGLLGEKPCESLMEKLQACERMKSPAATVPTGAQPYIAVASMEGVLINQHLGEAGQLLIYGNNNGKIKHIDTRKTPKPGTGVARWENLSNTIKDCGTLMVSGIGDSPRKVLNQKGINILVLEGVIEEAVKTVFNGGNVNHLVKRKVPICSGTGNGCG